MGSTTNRRTDGKTQLVSSDKIGNSLRNVSINLGAFNMIYFSSRYPSTHPNRVIAYGMGGKERPKHDIQ